MSRTDDCSSAACILLPRLATKMMAALTHLPSTPVNDAPGADSWLGHCCTEPDSVWSMPPPRLCPPWYSVLYPYSQLFIYSFTYHIAFQLSLPTCKMYCTHVLALLREVPGWSDLAVSVEGLWDREHCDHCFVKLPLV